MKTNRQSNAEAVINRILENISYTESYTRGKNLNIFVGQETLTLLKEYLASNHCFGVGEDILKIMGVEVKIAPDLSCGEFSIGVAEEVCMEEEDVSLDIKI